MKQRCTSTAFAPVAQDGLRVQASSPSKTKWEKHAGQGGIWTLGWGTRWVGKNYLSEVLLTWPGPRSGRPVAAQWPPSGRPSGRPVAAHK